MQDLNLWSLAWKQHLLVAILIVCNSTKIRTHNLWIIGQDILCPWDALVAHI